MRFIAMFITAVCVLFLIRLKFNMVHVPKHAIALDRNIFRVYKHIAHDIFILMFCNSLGQCKMPVEVAVAQG